MAAPLPWFSTVHDTVLPLPAVIVVLAAVNAVGTRSGVCTVIWIGVPQTLFASWPSSNRLPVASVANSR